MGLIFWLRMSDNFLLDASIVKFTLLGDGFHCIPLNGSGLFWRAVMLTHNQFDPFNSCSQAFLGQI